MSLESITKFQPDRRIFLRGSDGFGAHAALIDATASGFTVAGVFRDQGDFTVLMLYDADDQYIHYSLKPLPDFNVTNVSLSFDVQYTGLQPFDSARYSWIGWAQIQTIQQNGDPTQAIYLFDHATLTNPSTSFFPASGTFTFNAPGYYDEIYIVVNNVTFLYQCYNTYSTGADVAAFFNAIINNHDWSTYYNADIAVIASASGAVLTIQYARTGTVSVSGTAVTWTAGTKFPGLKAGDTINIGASAGNTVTASGGGPGGLQYTVASVNSPTSLTLSSAYAGSGSSGLSYVAPYGGVDGNALTIYTLVNPSNASLTATPAVLTLSGGTSYDAIWNISFPFASYGITTLRQAWFTFAPALADGAAYADTNWSAAFTNWTITDPSSVTPQKCAGPGSVRIGSHDSWVSYAGTGWADEDSNNNTYLGRARSTGNPTDSVTVKWACGATHDLYLGTFLYTDRGILSISIDGGSAITLDLFCNASEPFPARRWIKSGIGAGTHTAVLTLTSSVHAAAGTWDITGLGTYFWFDYLEAAIASDLPQSTQPTYLGSPGLSPALDYDTDQTYKNSPEFTMWQLARLGFGGDLNLYVGVFYWMEKLRGTNASFGVSTVVFAGGFIYGDQITVDIGGALYVKNVRDFGESNTTIAAHFARYINSGSVGVWASASAGTLTITVRSTGPTYVYSVTTSVIPFSGSSTGTATVTANGTNSAGTEGDWIVNPSGAEQINYPTRLWLADLYALCAMAGQNCVTSFSMELTNPPDWPTSPVSSPGVYTARFPDGSAVTTDTGLSYNGVLLSSTQCAPVPQLTAYQKLVYARVAGLQNAAGLTPWLQFGEFLWWFFSRRQNVGCGYVAYTTPISIGVAAAHGFSTGDRVIVSGVQGMTSANGTWTITVTDATHFTLNGSVPNGAWVSGTGFVSGGGMGYYDASTTAAFAAAHSRALYAFTCQDDDPTVNSSVDSAFLAAQLKAHVDAIRTYVLGLYAGAKFELLYPDDVNHATCIYSAAIPYPQGGRLNHAVSLPSAWLNPSTSSLDRIKIEALSWGSQYRSLDLAKSSMAAFPLYPASKLSYNLPIFNNGCPWPAETLAALNTLSFGELIFWAWDHFCLMSWPLPLPVNKALATSS